MERGVEEVLDASTRLLAEMKSGTRERTMLSTVTKTLKRRVQESRLPVRSAAQATPTKADSAARPSLPMSSPPPAPSPAAAPSTLPATAAPVSGSPTGNPDASSPPPTAAATSAPSTDLSTPEKASAAPADVTPSAATSSLSAAAPGEAGYSPLQRYLRSEEDISKLAYACRMAIIGENGSIHRSSARVLTASLELAAILLGSGIIPQELAAPEPVFTIAESTMTGAQVFFSKLLGGKRSTAGEGAAAESGQAGAGSVADSEARPKENVRGQLVDAVLTAVNAAQSKESSDRLFFVTVASLVACAVPRVSRATCLDSQSGSLRSQQLALHGERLVRVFRVLLAWCSRPQGLSPILVDEAQRAVHAITRALSKYVEYEVIGASSSGGDQRDPKRSSSVLQRAAPESAAQPAAQGQSSAASSAATSVVATPLMPLPEVVALAGRSGGRGSFSDPLATGSDDGAGTAASSAVRPATTVTNNSFPIMAPLSAASRRTVSADETTAVPPLTAPPPLRGARDMRMLLELCGTIARLTPLSGLPSGSIGAGSVSDIGTSAGGGGGSSDGGAGSPTTTTATNRGAASSGGGAASSGAMALAGSGGAVSTTSFPSQYMNAFSLLTSLSFILYCVVNGGPQFRKSAEIVQVLRQLIVPAAVRTSVSADLDTFRISVNLLLLVCLRFGPQMVNETSTVFRHVYFRVLDSTFTSLEHKLLVLDAFASYIEEPQLLLGLFLNYDCNTHSQSIYEMMIHYLGALAMPPAQKAVNSNLAADLKRVLTVRLEYDVPEALRRKALMSLLQVSDSNIQWIERFEYDQEEDSHGAVDSALYAHASSSGHGLVDATTAAAADDGDDGDDPLRRMEAAATAPANLTDSASPLSNADHFLQARRYKDAFRKFLDLFNTKATPEAAVEYLKNSLLTLEEAETETAAASPTAALAVSPEPQPANAETAGAAPEGESAVNGNESAREALGGAKSSEEDRDAAAAAAGVAVASGSGPAAGATGHEAEEEEEGAEEESVINAADAAEPASASNGGGAEADAAPPQPSVSDVDDAMRLSARRVAAFLRRNEDYVDKMILGDYFAKSFRKAATRVVFEEWIALHDFTSMTLDAALRLFLGGFKLLGEAQVVDRTMELFAAQYCRQNHGVFGSADTAFILSFSICMLNTDAHSPHIKNKMSKEGFLQNNKGIDEGNDVDPAILGGIYDRITRDEIVLRPSPKCATQPSSAKAADSGKRGNVKVTTSLLDSIPLLRHLAPIATAITDKVLLPMDAAGVTLFSTSQRKREELYQRELRTTLKAVMDALQEASTADAAHHAMFVTATSIENALPMWEVTVDVVCHLLLVSLRQLLDDAEAYVRPPALAAAAGSGEKEGTADVDAVTAFMEDTKSASYFAAMLTGLHNTVRVCCSFGNVAHTEQLLEHVSEMTHLSSVVVVSALPSPRVSVQSSLPFTRLHLLSTFLNLFVQCGASFNARGWQAAYKAMSLVDALANGVEGMWRRQTRRLLGSTLAPREAANGSDASKAGKAKGSSSPVAESRQYADLWFGALNDVPATVVDRASRENRKSILCGLRAAPASHVDLWLDHLFDATQYPSRVQLEMTNGLVKVCEMELQYGRTFSLTKLFDFVSICASFSSRLQWRDLWTHASEVFTLAGCGGSTDIALSSLDGLRLIALTYLMREELLNYSFQKEVLKPFEAILMSNQNVECRKKVMMIISELIDFRAEHLASAWNVVFSCLSHAAAIPDVAPDAWSICEGIMARHIAHLRDCFSDLIFCLTTFACSGADVSMPLRAISYLIACGHWLQYGLDALPPDVRSADTVARWAVRFHTAEQELAASRMAGRHLTRVTLAAEPLTHESPLTKPTTFTSKTKYHLWMSLFEGMVPIVVVHSSVRVRAHALSSIWTLLAQYATVFDSEVQNSLFSGMVRPMLTTLLTHVPEDAEATLPPMAGEGEFDRFDYRLLVYFALKGMLLACSRHGHLLSLACKALVELVETTRVSLRMLRNDYVVEVLRVCFDFVWAAPSLATLDALEQLDPLPSSASSAMPSEFENYAERLYQWIPEAARHDNPFVVGIVHEIQQIGVVDVVRFKRTAGWTELHQTPAALNLPVHVDLSELCASSVESASSTVMQIRATIYSCLTRGLLGQLHRLLSTVEGDRSACLAITTELGHVLLGVSFYFLVTRDARAVSFLKAVMSTAHDHVRRPTHEDQVSRIEAAAARAESKESSPAPPTGASPVFFDNPVGSAVETLLLIPYACVLLEFVAVFDLGAADNSVLRSDLHAYMRRCVDELGVARERCVELQRDAESGSSGDSGGGGAAAASTATTTTMPRDVAAAASTALDARDAFQVYKGLHFTDVFRSAGYPIASRVLYLTPQTTTTAVQHRVFAEWCYLLHVYAIKCIAILGGRSVLLQACTTRELVELLRLLPSTLEEGAVSEFMNSCWEEMNLHCSMPASTCMELCSQLIVARIEGVGCAL